MEQRIKIKLIFASLITAVLLASTAYGVTPTPKVSPKPTATSKPVASKSATASPKSSSTTTSSKKPSKKPTKKKIKKTATPIPSPPPEWPPVGFTTNKGIYAKIPSSKELLGLISAKAGLAELVKNCELNACGAVIVAADYTCKWWEIKSTVYGNDPTDQSKKIVLGKLRTTSKELAPKAYANIILASSEPLFNPAVVDPNTGESIPGAQRPGISVGGISAICHKSGSVESTTTNTYTPVK